MSHTEAIILSMTAKERATPRLLRGSRLTRIAKGSGTQVRDVNALLKQFSQMRKLISFPIFPIQAKRGPPLASWARPIGGMNVEG